MTPRLTKRSKPVRLLRAKFENGEITGKEDPKTVWETEDTFRACDITRFRTCYNNMRKEFDGKGTGQCDETLAEEECSEDVHTGMELTTDATFFKPIYTISCWSEPDVMTRRLSIAVLLPSGIGRGDFSYRVIDEGSVLEFTVTWPKAMTDVLMLHKWWLSPKHPNPMQPYHPKIIGFGEALKDYRDRCRDKITSSTRILLPFTVQAGIVDKANLAWSSSTALVCYIDLKAATDEYAVVNDNDDFAEA